MIIEHALKPGFSIGPLNVHWYGLMYLIGVFFVYFIGNKYAKEKNIKIPGGDLFDYIFILFIGMLIGARIGYVFIYWGLEYLQNPIKIIAIWEGGMSFHGALIGLIITSWIYTKKYKLSFMEMSDCIVLGAPIALFFGRIGNFINGELWGRPTDGTWGVIFPSGGAIARHPSQLYEAVLEGLVLFAIIYFLSRKKVPKGTLLGTFFIGYGIFRSLIELVRVPDVQVGYLWDFVTMGQMLSIPMILIGIGIIIYVFKNKDEYTYITEIAENNEIKKEEQLEDKQNNINDIQSEVIEKNKEIAFEKQEEILEEKTDNYVEIQENIEIEKDNY